MADFDVRISALTITRGSVCVKLDVEEIDGERYYPLRKKDTTLARLMFSGIEATVNEIFRDAPHYCFGHRARDAMARTTIFEDLKALKDAAYAERLDIPRSKDGKHFKATTQKLYIKKMKIPATCKIDAPTVGDVQGIAMNVKLDNCKQAVSVRVNTESLVYLSQCIAYQVKTSVDPRPSNVDKHRLSVEGSASDRPVSQWAGVYNSNRMALPFRACFKPPAGKVRTLYTSNRESAIAFAKSGKRPAAEADEEEEEEVEEAPAETCNSGGHVQCLLLEKLLHGRDGA